MCLLQQGNSRHAEEGTLLVTPYHPVMASGQWTFPGDVARRWARYTGSIYSVLLQRDADPDAHAIMVGGLWATTLGHGLTRMGQHGADVRAHQFLGDYDAVIKSLAGLHRSRSGLVLGAGVTRDGRTGLVDGFRRASPAQVREATRVAAAQGKGVVVRV